MEGESELRASDAFIAKLLITSEVFSLCNCVNKTISTSHPICRATCSSWLPIVQLSSQCREEMWWNIVSYVWFLIYYFPYNCICRGKIFHMTGTTIWKPDLKMTSAVGLLLLLVFFSSSFSQNLRHNTNQRELWMSCGYIKLALFWK